MINPQTDNEKKRAAWWAEHYKRGMSLDEVCRLNEELLTLFPMTMEERERKAKGCVDVPEFIL